MEQKTVKEFRHVSGSAPGLFEGTRWSSEEEKRSSIQNLYSTGESYT